MIVIHSGAPGPVAFDGVTHSCAVPGAVQLIVTELLPCPLASVPIAGVIDH